MQQHHSPNNDINGLVLAGGYSRRMGTDKGLIVYHERPQREFLWELLARQCRAVYISCRADQNVPAHLNPIIDAYDIPGPLNGILSAFSLNASTAWLAIAVDMPFVNDQAIEALLSGRDKTKVATCFRSPQTQQPEPLLTLWEPAAYPLLQKFAEERNVSPREFLKRHPVKLIEPPDERMLLNFNCPDDRHRHK
jgi:molybdenum cofactor guanylyltransferase